MLDEQVAEVIAAERESLSPECRADAVRLGRLLAPDFHEYGASGGEFGYEGTADQVAAETDPDGEPIQVENLRGWRLVDGLVMVKYTSEHQGRRANRTSLWRRVEPGVWQMFHHQGTLTTTAAKRDQRLCRPRGCVRDDSTGSIEPRGPRRREDVA
ncbi:MAG: DUF4440 domain-containing protein [Nocardioidaceae bacterium]